MLKYATRTIVALSVTMLAGTPAAIADTKAPAKSAKSTAPTVHVTSLSYGSIQYQYTSQAPD
jgi:hypothetical protein